MHETTKKRRAKIDALSRWMPDLRPRDILAGKIYLGSRCVAAGAKFDFLFEYVYFKDSCVEDSSLYRSDVYTFEGENLNKLNEKILFLFDLWHNKCY